ncbi:hypothetical protein F4680DRAFT_470216 [Xylaria scruposa]|nr:hypothetical protein F4680DRAFT_470216 [Xylaria scruposa]
MLDPFPVNRETLEVADYHKLWGACNRYISIFEPPLLGDRVPETTTLGEQGFTPWIIEAPLNSIELLEAVLKPSQPFKIYKARHVSWPPPIMVAPPKPVRKEEWSEIDAFWHEAGYKFKVRLEKRKQWLYKEFLKGQGRLMCDREISFVCLNSKALETMQEDFMFTYQAVQLNWITIPWNYGDGTTLAHPWALVLRRQPTPEYSYWDSFHRMLEQRGLSSLAESGFPRSLLKQGTVPLPETLRDWLMGFPGKTAALPYFTEEDAKAESSQHQLLLRPKL